MLNNSIQGSKIFFIIFVILTLSACFSEKKRAPVIIVDKSTGQENISHFSNTPEIKKSTLNKKINRKVTQKTKKKVVRKVEIKKKVIKKTEVKKKNVLIPVAAKISKSFSKDHQGLSFATKSGQKVRAVNNGTVVYSGNKIKSHGKMIIIKHPLGFYSTYAQNQSLNVKTGDKIEKGQVIATTGKTSLYFEMKKFETRINPTAYLK